MSDPCVCGDAVDEHEPTGFQACEVDGCHCLSYEPDPGWLYDGVESPEPGGTQ